MRHVCIVRCWKKESARCWDCVNQASPRHSSDVYNPSQAAASENSEDHQESEGEERPVDHNAQASRRGPLSAPDRVSSKQIPFCERCTRWEGDEWCIICRKRVCSEQCWESNAERCWECLGKPTPPWLKRKTGTSSVAVRASQHRESHALFQDDSNRSLLSEKKFSKECIRCCVLQNKTMSTIEVM